MYNWEENLSEHFKLKELTKVSQEQYQEINNNNLTDKEYNALRVLCQFLLEPIRNEFGVVIVNSGFRCEEYNRLIGGAIMSQHRFGEAVDFVCKYADLETIMRWIIGNQLEFGQLILEPSWIHLSLGAPFRVFEQCGQILKYDGKTYYRLNRNLEII
jgi:hypothetical protein